MAGQDSEPLFHWEYTEVDDRNLQIRGRTLFYVLVLLFSIISFVTLLILYARWISRFNPTPPQSGSTQIAGLDPTAINALPVVVVCHSSPSSSAASLKMSSSSMMECSICLGAIEEGQKLRVLPSCRHCYHCHCVDRWLAAQPICPLCRATQSTIP